MKKIITVLIVVVAFLSFGEIALADPISNPTHFDDTTWYFPASSSGYNQLDTNITPIVDGSPDGYYFSSEFYFTGDTSGYGGYLGLQTEGTIPTGKIAIFSIWGATSSSGPGYNSSGTEVEQTYYTSRIQYNWNVNHTYKTDVILLSQSSGSETWAATITDQSTGVQSLIGDIVTPSSMGSFSNEVVTFHERYSGSTASCSDMQESEVEFTNLSFNNGSVIPTSHSNVQPSGSACAGLFTTQDIPGGIETIIGGQFPPVVSAPTTTTTPAPVNKTTVKPAKLTVSKQNKPSNKPNELSLKLVGYYTAGIGILIAIVVIGYILFKKSLARKRTLPMAHDQNTTTSSYEMHVPSTAVEPTTIYPQAPEVPLDAQMPTVNQSPPESFKE
jgi:hypothetical protein